VMESAPTIGHAFHVDGVNELTAIIEKCVTEPAIQPI
jgi:hypothetical protein